jgi:hypothetical protein
VAHLHRVHLRLRVGVPNGRRPVLNPPSRLDQSSVHS